MANRKLGIRLAELRREHGWTQEELARRLGVTRAQIIRAESGLEVPDAGTLARTAELYGMSVNTLLEGTGRNAQESSRELAGLRRCFPLLCAAAFLILGFYCRMWRYAWLVVFAIPLFYSAVSAARERDPRSFAYPALALAVFLLWGLHGGWGRCWTVLVTIPLYYIAAAVARKK